MWHSIFCTPRWSNRDPNRGQVIQASSPQDMMFDAVARVLCCEAQTTSPGRSMRAAAVSLWITHAKGHSSSDRYLLASAVIYEGSISFG